MKEVYQGMVINVKEDEVYVEVYNREAGRHLDRTFDRSAFPFEVRPKQRILVEAEFTIQELHGPPTEVENTLGDIDITTLLED